MEQAAGGADRQRLAGAAEAIERSTSKWRRSASSARSGRQRQASVLLRRDSLRQPGGSSGSAASSNTPAGRTISAGFSRSSSRPAASSASSGDAGDDLGGGELAGGDVGVGEPGPLAIGDDARRCSCCAGHRASPGRATVPGVTTRVTSRSTSPLPFRDLADLLADRDLVPGRDQAGDVALGGVVGDAGHRHALALAHLAAGQDDVEHSGRDLGVLLERFVEVAEPEKEDRVGKALLDLQILAPQRNHRRNGLGLHCVGHWRYHWIQVGLPVKDAILGETT